MLKSLIPPSLSLENGSHRMSYPHLRTIILGGETTSQGLLSAWTPLGAPWTAFNEYGPTEATCGVLTGPFLWNDASKKFENSLLGLPIPGAVVKLRGADGEELSAGDGEGEIMIGGICLAEGYWRDPDRTAERFVMWNSGRYYRTGDHGRWSRVGDSLRIDFLGRTDRVVKNRGFLVNLEREVDACVLGPDSTFRWKMSDAFTVMVDGFMCMLASPPNVDVNGLKTWMAERLPAYQVPDRIIATENLPRGRTGKVDPKAVRAAFKQPETDCGPLEQSFLEDWEVELRSNISDILGLPRRVLPAEKFLELGGHSLAAVAISGRCRQLGAFIEPRQVLLGKTIGDLIEACREARQIRRPENIDAHTSTLLPRVGNMTKTQLALIYASNQSPGSSIIQMSFLFPTHIIPVLRQAWKRALETETIFQKTFDVLKGTQSVQDSESNFSWSETTVISQETYEMESQHVSIAIGVSTAFNFVSFHEQSRLVWTIHHALIDGFSASLLLQKVHAALHGIPVNRDIHFYDWLKTFG
jgi:gliotoxin/aspirochlorine biosynthesis peptide synthetase